jgi:DNA-directed RNA polymerase subunit RPC12/RpoP
MTEPDDLTPLTGAFGGPWRCEECGDQVSALIGEPEPALCPDCFLAVLLERREKLDAQIDTCRAMVQRSVR